MAAQVVRIQDQLFAWEPRMADDEAIFATWLQKRIKPLNGSPVFFGLFLVVFFFGLLNLIVAVVLFPLSPMDN